MSLCARGDIKRLVCYGFNCYETNNFCTDLKKIKKRQTNNCIKKKLYQQPVLIVQLWPRNMVHKKVGTVSQCLHPLYLQFKWVLGFSVTSENMLATCQYQLKYYILICIYLFLQNSRLQLHARTENVLYMHMLTVHCRVRVEVYWTICLQFPFMCLSPAFIWVERHSY